MDKINKILDTIPKYFNVRDNPVWRALLTSHGLEDERISQQVREANNQIFVEKAEGRFLDQLGQNFSIFRPGDLNLSDVRYRELIKALSFAPKQVRSTIYRILDIFFDSTFSHYSLESRKGGPYDLSLHRSLVYSTENDQSSQGSKRVIRDGGVDGVDTLRVANTNELYVGMDIEISDSNNNIVNTSIRLLTENVITTQHDTSQFLSRNNPVIVFKTYSTIVFDEDDFEDISKASANEVVDAINKKSKTLTAETASLGLRVVIRTNTPGYSGSLEVLGGTANDQLSFERYPTRDLIVSVSEVRSNELIVRMPFSIPTLRRTLRGSHHIHKNAAIQENWAGSFLFDNRVNYTIQKISTSLSLGLVKSQSLTQLAARDTSSFPNEGGFLAINFGRVNQELGIPYLARPNNSTLLIDPSYKLKQSHAVDSKIYKMIKEPTNVRRNGDDYAVYLTGSIKARIAIQDLIRSVVTAGVRIRFDITSPTCGK